MFSKTKGFACFVAIALFTVNSLEAAAVAYRGPILHFLSDPQLKTPEDSYEYFEDGVLVVDEGKVVCVGKAEEQLADFEEIEIHAYDNHKLILPGLIDTHIDYLRSNSALSCCQEFLDELIKGRETKFLERQYREKVGRAFVQELLGNGVTTAVVFSVSPESMEFLSEEAQSYTLRLIFGEDDKPAPLQDDTESPFDAFYHATLGGAKTLGLDSVLGNFESGKDADFVIVGLDSPFLLNFLFYKELDLQEKLSLLKALRNHRNAHETYIFGKRVYQKGAFYP